MAWIALVLAGLLEVVWAVGLKFSEGFTRRGPALITGLAILASMWLLGLAVRTLPVGTAYAIWVGIGATGTAVVGMLVFGEPASPARLFFLALLVTALAGLKLTAP